MSKDDVQITKLEIDLQAEVRKVFPQIGQFTENEIKWNSPVGYTEIYQEGWTHQITDGGRSVTVFNHGKHKSLTHLLEKGHLSKSGSWVAAQPHILPAYKTAKKEYIALLEQIPIKPKKG